MTHDKILIVDFGSQVTQLIARRVREEGVYCAIVPFQKAEAAFDEMKPRGVIQDEKRKYYGLMFHPEVVHTPHGAALLRNFVRKIAGARGDWTMRAFKDEAIEKIRAQVGKGRVICGLSGGVDSAVAAVLIHEAIGEQLTCVFVDHGLLRLGEAQKVITLFRDSYNIPLVHVAAEKPFLDALA